MSSLQLVFVLLQYFRRQAYIIKMQFHSSNSSSVFLQRFSNVARVFSTHSNIPLNASISLCSFKSILLSNLKEFSQGLDENFSRGTQEANQASLSPTERFRNIQSMIRFTLSPIFNRRTIHDFFSGIHHKIGIPKNKLSFLI